MTTTLSITGFNNDVSISLPNHDLADKANIYIFVGPYTQTTRDVIDGISESFKVGFKYHKILDGEMNIPTGLIVFEMLRLAPDNVTIPYADVARVLRVMFESVPSFGGKIDVPFRDWEFSAVIHDIETGLHPSIQRLILPALQNCFPKSKIFLSTNSAFVVGSVGNAWLYRVNLTKSVLVSAPQLLVSGRTHPVVMDETFGVGAYFDAETELRFKGFYEVRDLILSHKEFDIDGFRDLCRDISDLGPETNNIIVRELRQLRKITGLNIWA